MTKSKSNGSAPASPEGARSASAGEAGAAAAGPGAVRRWSAGRKREVVLRLLRGESIDALSREFGVEIYRLEHWRERALAGLDAGLKERESDPVEAKLDEANRRIGELTMEIEILRREREARHPLVRRRSSR
jgi:transposase-like protein